MNETPTSSPGRDLRDAGLRVDADRGVAWLRLDRPHVRNAIDHATRDALLDGIARVRAEPNIRSAVITGTGSAFCSGADLSTGDFIEIPPGQRRGGPGVVAREDGLRFGWWRIFQAIWENDKPFLAAVNGPAVGFGCQLAFACDLVIASEDARFTEIFVRRGLPLEGGGAYVLPRFVSLPRAKELALFGDPLPATQAEQWGLVNRVVPAADFDETVRVWAERLASGPTVTMGHIKQQLNTSLDSQLATTLREEVTLLGIGGGEDQAEAMRAWQERRDPRLRGPLSSARPRDPQPRGPVAGSSRKPVTRSPTISGSWRWIGWSPPATTWTRTSGAAASRSRAWRRLNFTSPSPWTTSTGQQTEASSFAPSSGRRAQSSDRRR
jgi:2-(1,2-epoxy-1,2-dihydrophenyl)acetyl-CoA isomerase